MKLEPQHESILKGESSQVLALAMKTLVNYGDAFGARRLVPITSCHLAGSFGIGAFAAYYKILDRMVADGLQVKVKTTVNPRSGHYQNLMTRLPFSKQERLEHTLDILGVTPNYSCVCYESENVPAFGDYLGWAESSAVQFANSVLGARSNRNSCLIDICSAVTGVTPEFGYLLDENRQGRLLVKLDIEHMDAVALGYILGRTVVNRVPVIEHYDFSRIELKNMGGAMAASGAVALFHVEGVTPEAPDLKTVFGGPPPETITITQKDLDALRFKELESAGMVVFGCPQMTYDEALSLAPYFEGKRVTRRTWFCMVPESLKRFKTRKEYSTLLEAGIEINAYCPLAALSFYFGKKPILTCSGKLYYYLAGAEYGNVDDCLRACGVKP